MKRAGEVIFHCLLVFLVNNVVCSDNELYDYLNRTDPSTRQLYDFKIEHPRPIGILTTSSGKLVEIRESVTLNSDAFSNQYHIDSITHANNERIPERIVHAKGGGAFGYFEVTHDVSKYIKADLFNGIGKITPAVVRFSSVAQNLGGNDLAREMKGLAVKFYSQEGNLDLLCINFPVYFYRDPVDFVSFAHAFKRNPKTNLYDFTMRWDFITKRPDTLHGILWLLSDYGIPNGYRKMDAFPIHTYEIYNKNGERFFIRFNFRTEQGIQNLPTYVAQAIAANDLDYFNRDLYNAIANENYPAWKLEMDVMTFNDIKNVDYNPFEVTRMWKKGTYHTVQIGRLVLDRNPDNYFRVVEQSAFNPGNLVPGIPGPLDNMYKTRRSSYRDTHVYRLGVNHNRIDVNMPLYWKVYNRDGLPPVKNNMKDAPNYYPNSFSGPIPYIDPSRPKERLTVYETNAVDLEPASYFYNDYLTEDQRIRLVNNTAPLLVPVAPFMRRRVLRLFTLVDEELGTQVSKQLQRLLQVPPPPPPEVLTVPRQHYDENDYSQYLDSTIKIYS
ncbi:catalase-like [Vanessa atalanta]|uniref:catalase-like n=1 Tax=Vanessa atalanta TaxID=42275 RepID=UPI001FCE2CCF|nr:catalase-like [Vanessa atalanta]